LAEITLSADRAGRDLVFHIDGRPYRAGAASTRCFRDIERQFSHAEALATAQAALDQMPEARRRWPDVRGPQLVNGEAELLGEALLLAGGVDPADIEFLCSEGNYRSNARASFELRRYGFTPPIRQAQPALRWHLAEGDTIRRSELHDIYGGSRQGGTIPSRTSPNIFLFLDPEIGAPHGYFDGWVGDRFYYTGHGQTGDQEFRAGNAAVLRHREDGRVLRVFRGAAGVVRYLGEFELDEEQPFFRMEAPESKTRQPRQVIVFRLNPVGSVVHDPEDELELPEGLGAPALDAIVSGRIATPVIVDMPIEQQNVEEVEVSRASDSYTAVRREQALVIHYSDYLRAKGSTVSRFRVQPPGEARAIVCDLYDETRNNLVEAKGTGARGEVRMAIGQLTDYARFRTPSPALAVLLPARPRSDLEALLAAAGISAIWPDKSGFADNAEGRFS
jgi:hypothetical protein